MDTRYTSSDRNFPNGESTSTRAESLAERERATIRDLRLRSFEVELLHLVARRLSFCVDLDVLLQGILPPVLLELGASEGAILIGTRTTAPVPVARHGLLAIDDKVLSDHVLRLAEELPALHRGEPALLELARPLGVDLVERPLESGDRSAMVVPFEPWDGATAYLVAVARSPFERESALPSALRIARTLAAAAALAESFRRVTALERRSRSLIDSAADAIFVFDGSSHILHANQRAAELCRRSIGDLVGRSYFDLLPATDRALAASSLESLLAHGRHFARKVRICRPDGSIAEVDVSSAVAELDDERVAVAIAREPASRSGV